MNRSGSQNEPSVWPGILIIGGVIALIYLFSVNDSTTSDYRAPTPTTQRSKVVPPRSPASTYIPVQTVEPANAYRYTAPTFANRYRYSPPGGYWMPPATWRPQAQFTLPPMVRPALPVGPAGGGGDLDCADINGTVWVGDYDPHGLDRDNDGWGCE